MLLCGLPGTGKTWVALRLALPFRASVHRSDIRRKQSAGIPRTSRRREGFERGLYSAEMTERVYGSLREDAEAELRAGRTVIVDAAFPRRAERAAFAEAARRAGRSLWILHVQAPEPVVLPDGTVLVLDAGVLRAVDRRLGQTVLAELLPVQPRETWRYFGLLEHRGDRLTVTVAERDPHDHTRHTVHTWALALHAPN